MLVEEAVGGGDLGLDGAGERVDEVEVGLVAVGDDVVGVLKGGGGLVNGVKYLPVFMAIFLISLA